MAWGAMGALSATAPVEAALSVTDWRGIFSALALLTLIVAAAVFWIVPEKPGNPGELRFGDQIRGSLTTYFVVQLQAHCK